MLPSDTISLEEALNHLVESILIKYGFEAAKHKELAKLMVEVGIRTTQMLLHQNMISEKEPPITSKPTGIIN